MAIFLLFIIIVLTIGWHIFKSDHPYLIEKLQTHATEKYNLSLHLKGYELSWKKPFPNLQIKIKDLQIANQESSEFPFFKTNLASSQFNLWQLKSGNYDAQPIYLDSVWVHIFKDSLGNKNTTIKNNASTNTLTKNETAEYPTKNSASTLRNFPKLDINFLDFHHQNNESKKWQSAQLFQPNIQLQQKSKNEIEIQLLSDCHFDGLVFNEKSGGFLMDQAGELNLNLYFLEKEKLVRLENSSLQVEEMNFNLAGSFQRADTNQLILNIQTDGVILQKVLPLLSNKINKILDDIKIDQPIQANFSINKFLNSEKRGIIDLDFATSNALLDYKDIPITSAMLSGYFSNDCDKIGVGSSKNSCLTIHQLDGDILDILSTKLSGKISRFKNPLVDLDGEMYFDLPSLNKLLAPKDKITFTKGHAMVNYKYQGVLENLLNSPFDEQDIQLQGDANFYELTVKTDNRYAPAPSLTGHLSFDENQATLDDMFLDWMGSQIKLSGQVGDLPEFIFYHDEALKANVKLHFDQINVENFTKENSEKTKVNQEKPINAPQVERLFRRLASSVNGKIQLQVDSLFLENLFLTDLQSQFHLLTPRRPEFIDSTMIRVDKLNAKFMGKSFIQIDLGLTRDSITDLWVELDLPSAIQPANFFLPKNIEIGKGDASLNLYAKMPLRSIFNPNNLLPTLAYQGKINFDKTEINTNSVELPIRKITGPLTFSKQQMNFDSLRFSYEGSPFLINGNVKNYTSLQNKNGEKISIDLKLKGNFLNLRKEKKSEEDKIKQAAESPKLNLSPAKIFQDLDSVFQLATGKIDLQLDSILNNRATIYPFLLRAQLIPDKEFNGQHQLVIDSFNISYGKKNTIKGSGIIKNPEEPFLQAHFKTRLKFKQVGKLMRSDFLLLKKGYFLMDFDYKSQLHDTLDAKNYFSKAEIDGSAEIVDGKIYYNYREFEFKNIYSHFSFNEKDIFFRDVDFEVNDNRIFASGQSINFFPFFIFPNRKANIEMKLTSPFFDFGKFKVPENISKDTLLIAQDSATTSEGIIENAGTLLDELLAKGSMEITTDIKKLAYQKFLAKNILGKISLQPDSVHLENLNMNIADGTFTVDGLISNVANHEPNLEIAVEMEKNDLKELFRQFKNFGQTDFGHKNLQGDASAQVLFKTKINSNYSILTETMEGELKLKLAGGKLTNVDLMKTLPNFLSKKRKLENLFIDTMETNIYIRGNNIYLDKMSFISSAFHFGIQGVYSLKNTDDTRILLRVPFSNLHKKYFSEEEIKAKTAKRKGLPILIEAKIKKDKLKFRWKLFNRKKDKRKYSMKNKKVKNN